MRNPADQAGIRRPSAPKTTPCCSKVGIKRGPWTAEEDEILASYIKKEGEGAWRTLPKRAGLLRCGKSCRLRWMNYLRPHLNRGPITPDEEDLILRLHRLLGNRWSLIAGRIPGRTDNEIKNFWNTHLSKKLISQGLDPRNHKPLVVYNPNPNHNTTANNSNDDNNQNYARPRPQVENSTMEAIPNPKPIVSAPPTSNTSMPNSSPVVLNQEDEMYFSSFLDSLIMNEESVFDQQAVSHNQHMLQDQSMMMMMMQPTMGFESNHSQGFVWGSDREVSGFSNYPRDEGNRNLDPAEMHKH